MWYTGAICQWSGDIRGTSLRKILAVSCWSRVGIPTASPRCSYQITCIRAWPCHEGIQLSVEGNGILWSSTLCQCPLRWLVFCRCDVCRRAKCWQRWSRHLGKRGTSSTWTMSRWGWLLVRSKREFILIQIAWLWIGMFLCGTQTRSYFGLVFVCS